MARKKGKEWDSRRRLVDAAWGLLLEKGAAGMSVEAIVARAGLSKGTFFHFFPAKQDLLDAVCMRIAEESWRDVGGIIENEEIDPVERMDRFFKASRSWRTQRPKAITGLWLELSRPENSVLMSKVLSFSIDRLAPPMARLVEAANRAGTMRVEDVEVSSRLLVEWLSAAVEGSMHLLAEGGGDAAADMALRRANATISAFERALGMEEGSLTRVDPGIIAALAAGMPEKAEAGAPAGAAPPPSNSRSVGRAPGKGDDEHGSGREEPADRRSGRVPRTGKRD